jgi:hypothetical protein
MICRAEAPEIEQFAREHGDVVTVVGMGANNTMADAEEFADAGGIESFLMLWDESFEVWNAFGVTGTPAAVLLAGDGQVLDAWQGRLPLDDVIAAAQNT